jgi:hypothetical protein
LHIVDASDWIAKQEAARERRLGIIERRTVEAPSDLEYPKGKKRCANCGKESAYNVPLDGKNYYCSAKDCQTARVRRYDRLAVA